MALFCQYLSLKLILVFILQCNSLQYEDFEGHKYIILDDSSSNTADFYSSLFDSQGNVDISELQERTSRRRRGLQHHLDGNHNVTQFASATEFEFKGDNHTVAFLHWSGTKSRVIFIYTSDYLGIKATPVGNAYFQSAYIWRSSDYGTTFNREDFQKFHKSSRINGIRFCDTYNQRVVVFDQVKRIIYVSDDEGQTYKPNTVSFIPYDVMCIGNKRHNLLLAYDLNTTKLYYSKRGGATNTWHFVSSNVNKYYWIPEITGKDSTTVFLEIQSKHYSSILKYIKLPNDASEVKVFDPKLGEFESHSLLYKGKYLFVKKRYPSMSLWVSYNGSSFKNARFPGKYNEKDYHIFDASGDEVMAVVQHGDEETGSVFYNLYISDTSGTKFSLSLTNVLASSAYHWSRKLKLADIHKVESLHGVLLANTIVPVPGGNHEIKTFISFDKGGNWRRLQVPTELKGKCRNFYSCHLNLHMVHSARYYQITSVLSSKSAVGLIMAQGDVGRTLTASPNVFLSVDGGLTWRQVLYGRYDYVFGDHGGIIVAVPIRTYTDTVKYSCTEGNSWENVSLNKDVKAYGLVTEPGETTLIANIFGQHRSSGFEWLSVKLNLSSVFQRKCNMNMSDYVDWTPNDERMTGKCLMGEIVVYERRKANVSCFNGEEYDRKISSSSCNCTMEDFTCDFGFVKTDSSGCYSSGDEYIVPENCPELTTYKRTSGYRKVPGDRCVGGIEDDFKPKDTLCPVQGPSGLSIIVDSSTIPSYENITFHLKQQKGSTKTTWYRWNFGDSSQTVKRTGIDRVKTIDHNYTHHGTFNVTVTANNSVGYDTTRMAVKVIDKIKSLRIIRPYGILVDLNVTFNITLFSYHGSDWNSYHGFVHFVWTFDVDSREKPLLTWERAVSHVYTKPGKYLVKVEAINAVSTASATIPIVVHDEVRTVQLTFDETLDKENKGTFEWREEFAKIVLYTIVQLLPIDQSRLEVFVSAQVPPYVEVTIIQRDDNSSITMDEAVKKIMKLVAEKRFVVKFDDGKSTKVMYAEVIDRTAGKKKHPTTTNSKVDIRLPIAISVAAFAVIVFLAALMFYLYRRYRWFYTRYHRLSMNGGDGFVPLNRSSQESLGVNMVDEAVSYHVPSSDIAHMEDSDDELLLNDAGPGRVLVINADEQDEMLTTYAVQA